MNTKERYTVNMNVTTNRFEIQTDEDIAFIDYRWHNQTLVLLYIFVPPAYRGKGISAVLIQHALKYARTEGVKIKVFCHYISRYIRTYPEYEDLLEK